jgi:pimeloyl-ACP methyl ester carboxylesterase
MNKVTGKKITIDGREVKYYVAGQGEPVVIIHGGGGDARTLEKNVAALAEKYTVYAPDLPGYGGSQPLDGDYYIPEFSEFLEKFARSLKLEKFHLVGHSLGGGIALDYALKFPHRAKKLVLISSLCLGKEIAFWVRLLSIPAIIRSLGALSMAVLQGVRWVFGYLNPAALIMPLTPYAVTVGGSITTFKQQTHVLSERLAEVGMPTLVVWGDKDQVVPVLHAYKAAYIIPDCRLKVYENRGHNVHRDELASFSSTINDFLG